MQKPRGFFAGGEKITASRNGAFKLARPRFRQPKALRRAEAEPAAFAKEERRLMRRAAQRFRGFEKTMVEGFAKRRLKGPGFSEVREAGSRILTGRQMKLNKGLFMEDGVSGFRDRPCLPLPDEFLKKPFLRFRERYQVIAAQRFRRRCGSLKAAQS